MRLLWLKRQSKGLQINPLHKAIRIALDTVYIQLVLEVAALLIKVANRRQVSGGKMGEARPIPEG